MAHDTDAGWIRGIDAQPLGRGTVATASYSHFGDVTVRGV